MPGRELEAGLSQLVRSRIARNRSKIEHSLKQIAAGNPLGSEPKAERMINRISAKSGLSLQDTAALTQSIRSTARQIDEGKAPEDGREARQGPTIDFVGVEFLSRGRVAANAVGRVTYKSGSSKGTGFLVGPGLFLTNNHVIETPEEAGDMLVEFDYEADEAGADRPITVFGFDPARCFVFDPIKHFDFTLIAIGSAVRGTKPIETFGFMPLSDASDKHMLGEIANIIQHPQGRLKQIVVRENNLVSRDETSEVLHYIADTEKGSSGSPVCNNEWEPIALHHWGGPGLEITGNDGRPLRRDINEGIRVSAIVRELRARVGKLRSPAKEVVDGVLRLWSNVGRPGPVSLERTVLHQNGGALPAGQPRLGADGSLTWTFPVEISVRSPLASPAAPVTPPVLLPSPSLLRGSSDAIPEQAERADTDFASRAGYEPGFIPGFVVPMPDFDAVPYPLAVNREASRARDRNELRYHHFSIVMNAKRRLAAVTACNVDGSRLFSINRRDKTAKKATTPSDLDIESMGAEASDDFQPDPRVEDDQMAVDYYAEQEVPGFAKPKHPGKKASKKKRSEYARAMNERTARMFQKGHIIMRGDPAWGTKDAALAAEADTFFYTNAAPQLGFFNQGSPDDRPGIKGRLRWRALETYVLRNAMTMRQRVCVFAGPVFDDRYDVAYRFASKVPMRFWKIAVWADEDELRAIALLADQKPVLNALTQGVPEAYDDQVELKRVSEFLTSVEDIESRTKLDFGAAIRRADVRAGRESLTPAADADLGLLVSQHFRRTTTVVPTGSRRGRNRDARS